MLGMTVDARTGETLSANRLNGRFQSRLQSMLVSGGIGQQKKYCDDHFQTLPGPIPGYCIPAFTARYPAHSPVHTILSGL